LKKKLGGNAHILTEYTGNNIKTGCLMSGRTTNDYIANLLEPTYIIYPYKVETDVPANGILFSAAAADEVSLPGSSIQSLVGVMQSVALGNRTSLAFKPAVKKPDVLFESSKPAYKIFRCIAGPDSEDVSINANPVTLFPLANTPVVEVSTENPDIQFSATPADQLFMDGVTYSTVPVGAYEYSLRHPASPGVKEDWDNLKFTEDEAQFLTDLNLSPYVMNKIYKGPWQKTLSDNLATIVRSKCFTDTRVVLDSVCQESQKFIMKVMDYYIQNSNLINNLEENVEQAKMLKARQDIQRAIALERAKLALMKEKAVAATVGAISVDPFDPKRPYPPGTPLTLDSDVTQETMMDRPTYVNDTNPSYRINITVTNENDHTTRIALLTCDTETCTSPDTANNYFKNMVVSLIKNFPGYVFNLP
jgi:hypothetical protein